MKSSVFFLLLCVLFISCKKDRLKDEKSLLIGKWEWQRSSREFDICNPPIYYEVLTPITENKSYQIEFEKKGKVTYFEDNQKVEEYRLVFENFVLVNSAGPTRYSFYIYLDNNKGNILKGTVYEDGDSLSVWEYPFLSDNMGLCESYRNTFYKVQ